MEIDLKLIEKTKLEEPMNIEADEVCIAGDFHVPFQDNDLVEKMIFTCHDDDIKTVIVNGDFLDCKNLSNFIDIQQTELTFNDEIEEAGKILKSLCKNFDKVYFINSNHEARFARKMEGNSDIRNLYSMFDGNLVHGKDYYVSLYDYLKLNNSWYICHPNFYSRISLSIPRALASKYQMNVIIGHVHRLAIGKDDSGKFYVLESGGLFDPSKLEYLRNTSKNPSQTSGFVIIKNNFPSIYFGKSETF